MGCWPPDIAIFARPTPVSLVAWPFVNFKFRSGRYSWALLCLHNDYNPCMAKIIVKAKLSSLSRRRLLIVVFWANQIARTRGPARDIGLQWLRSVKTEGAWRYTV